MKCVLCVVVAVACGAIGLAANEASPKRVPANEIGSKVLLIGDLGVPLGEEVTIRGEKQRYGPFTEWFWIHELNGKKLEQALGMKIECIDDWPDGTEATLVGYEEGYVRYLQVYDTNISSDEVDSFKPHQTVFNDFVPVEVVEPESLKLSESRPR